MLLLSVALASSPGPLPLLGGVSSPTPLREGVPVTLELDAAVSGCTWTTRGLVRPDLGLSDRRDEVVVAPRDGALQVTLGAPSTLPPGTYRLLLEASGGSSEASGGSSDGCSGVYEHALVVPAAEIRVVEPSMRIERIAPFRLGRLAGLLPEWVDDWVHDVQCPPDEYPQCSENRVYIPIVETGGSRSVGGWTATASVERWEDRGNADDPVSPPRMLPGDWATPVVEVPTEPKDDAHEPARILPEAGDDPAEHLVDAHLFRLRPGGAASVALEFPDPTPLGTSEIGVTLDADALTAPVTFPVTLEVRRSYGLLIAATLVGAFLQLFNKVGLPAMREANQLTRHVDAVRRYLRGQSARQDTGLQALLEDKHRRLPSTLASLNPFRWTTSVGAVTEVDLSLRPRLEEWNNDRTRVADAVRALETTVLAVGTVRVQPALDGAERALQEARKALAVDDLGKATTALDEARRAVDTTEDQVQRDCAALAAVLEGFATGRTPLRKTTAPAVRAAVQPAATLVAGVAGQAQPGESLRGIAAAHQAARRALDTVRAALTATTAELAAAFGPTVPADLADGGPPLDATSPPSDTVARARALQSWAEALHAWSGDRGAEPPPEGGWAAESVAATVKAGTYWAAPVELAGAGVEAVTVAFATPRYEGAVGSPIPLTAPIPVEALPSPPTFSSRNVLLATVETSLGVVVLCFVAYLTYADKFVGTPSECFVVMAFAYFANLGLDSLLSTKLPGTGGKPGAEGSAGPAPKPDGGAGAGGATPGVNPADAVG